MILAISSAWAIAIGALGAVASLALPVAAFGHRRRREDAAAEDRTAKLLEELHSRIDELGREVSDALEQSREQAQARRFEGAESIDLDTVLGNLLAAARSVSGADAALVTVAGPGEDPLTRTDGLTARDERPAGFWPPPAGRLRRLRLEYDSDGDPARIGAGLLVPIKAESSVGGGPEPAIETPTEVASALETIGLLGIFARGDRGAFSEAEAGELEEIGRRSAPAVANALRFHDAQQRAVIDSHTGLHNKAYFQEALATEVLRAKRHERPLAVLTFDLDDFKAINERYGHPAADEVVAEIAKRIRDSRARPADIPCRTGSGDEFAVILPESTLEGAAQVHQRLRAAIAARPLVHVDSVSLSAGIAELWLHESDSAFFKRANDAQRLAKRYGKERLAASVTFEQAARQAGFDLWTPERIPQEWTSQVIHLPSLGLTSVTEVVLVTYASAIEGDEVLLLTESAAAAARGPDPDSGATLKVDRGGTTILLESKTRGREWLASVAETLVPVELPDEAWTIRPAGS